MADHQLWNLFNLLFFYLTLIGWLLGCLICLGLGLIGIVYMFQAQRGRAASASSLVTAGTGGILVWLSVDHFQSYGLALFLGLPVYCGILSTIFFNYKKPQTLLATWGVIFLTFGWLGIIVILFALDGLLCILMAAPLALVMGFGSSLVTYWIMKKWHGPKKDPSQVMSLLLVCGTLPFLVGFESLLKLSLPESVVVTSMEIAAPPQVVWKYVPSFAPIPDPPEFPLSLGLAYPVESKMVGSGLGAERLCVLSTGPVREKITAWLPEQLLRFTVLSCPPSMREISIYPNLQTPHLENFFISKQGEFRLTLLPNGHTLLQGTSWYYNRMWPSQYWLPLSDLIVKRIHLRVLNYVKHQAEADYRR